MFRIKRVLIATDFGRPSDAALDYAIDLAARHGATLHLLHAIDEATFARAYPDGLVVELPGLRQRRIDEANTQLASLAARGAEAGVRTTMRVALGRPDRVVVAEATALGTDLIVMGTHGRSPFVRMMLGSVAVRVLRSAPCPVLTVRDARRAANVPAKDTEADRELVS